MSLTAAVRGANFVLLAADLRASGPDHRADVGGKVTWTARGWATTHGPDVSARHRLLPLYVAAHRTDGSPAAFLTAFVEEARRLDPSGPVAAPLLAGWRDDQTPALYELGDDGHGVERPAGWCRFACVEEEFDGLRQHGEDVVGADGRLEAVRRLAGAFADVAERQARVSPHVTVASVHRGGGERRTSWFGRSSKLADLPLDELSAEAMPFPIPTP